MNTFSPTFCSTAEAAAELERRRDAIWCRVIEWAPILSGYYWVIYAVVEKLWLMEESLLKNIGVQQRSDLSKEFEATLKFNSDRRWASCLPDPCWNEKVHDHISWSCSWELIHRIEALRKAGLDMKEESRKELENPQWIQMRFFFDPKKLATEWPQKAEDVAALIGQKCQTSADNPPCSDGMDTSDVVALLRAWLKDLKRHHHTLEMFLEEPSNQIETGLESIAHIAREKQGKGQNAELEDLARGYPDVERHLHALLDAQQSQSQVEWQRRANILFGVFLIESSRDFREFGMDIGRFLYHLRRWETDAKNRRG